MPLKRTRDDRNPTSYTLLLLIKSNTYHLKKKKTNRVHNYNFSLFLQLKEIAKKKRY